MADLPALRELYLDEFGAHSPTLEQMILWYECNPNIFHLIVETNLVGDQERKIVGTFKAIPLRLAAVGAFEIAAKTVDSITEEDIVLPQGSPSGWYLGGVIAMGEEVGAYVFNYMVDFFKERPPFDVPFFARPLTEKGLELLEDLHFQQVDTSAQDCEIWSLHPPKITDLRERLRKPHPGRIRTKRRKRRLRANERVV